MNDFVIVVLSHFTSLDTLIFERILCNFIMNQNISREQVKWK